MSDAELPDKAQLSVSAAITLSEGIDPSSVRHVRSVGFADNRGLALISARSQAGTPCFTFLGQLGVTREFSCLRDGRSAIVRFVAAGGTQLGAVEWVSVIGIVRGDVTQIELVSRDGASTDLPLNEWRAFAYTASNPAKFPVALRAYGRDGVLVEDFATSP